jgi:hypothetical protein
MSKGIKDKKNWPYGILFYGTNINRPGIKNGDTFMVTITNFNPMKEVTVTPGK